MNDVSADVQSADAAGQDAPRLRVIDERARSVIREEPKPGEVSGDGLIFHNHGGQHAGGEHAVGVVALEHGLLDATAHDDVVRGVIEAIGANPYTEAHEAIGDIAACGEALGVGAYRDESLANIGDRDGADIASGHN